MNCKYLTGLVSAAKVEATKRCLRVLLEVGYQRVARAIRYELDD